MPEKELEQLLSKYEVTEKRKRSFYWTAFFFVNLKCLINGMSRHKDRLGLYHEQFKIKLSTNTFSDRLSQLPTDFCTCLLKRIQVHLNRIANYRKRNKSKNMINTLLAEDGTIFNLDKRLLEKFGATGHVDNVALKLYLNINVLGDIRLDGKIERCNTSDASHKGFKPLESLHN